MSTPSKSRARMSSPGPGVDAYGAQVIDPTENVKALSDAANKRQDDLRENTEKLFDAKAAHLKEIAELRAVHQDTIGRLREEYQEKIAHAESSRLDSIRQVDREEIAKTAVAANTAITTLAKQTTDLASTLQKQVADTATVAEVRNSTQYTDVNKRLSALELSSSEGKGKQTVVDPQMEKLTTLVEMLSRNQDRGTGKSEGIALSWAVVLAIGGLVVGAGTFSFIRTPAAPTTASPPQIIYVPAPVIEPTTPKVTVPTP